MVSSPEDETFEAKMRALHVEVHVLKLAIGHAFKLLVMDVTRLLLHIVEGE